MELNLTKPIVFIDLETTGINITADVHHPGSFMDGSEMPVFCNWLAVVY